MNIKETVIGKMHTMHLTDTSINGTISATLSGIEQHRYALIDGLIWYAIGRKLEALWEKFQTVERTIATKHGHEVASALVQYVHTVPFHELPEERQKRIAHTITKHVPELATLAKRVRDPNTESEVASVMRLAELLASRIEHPHDAGHGLEGIITHELHHAA